MSTLSREQEELVLANLDLAKQVAWKTAKSLPMEIEDAMQLAYIGLMQAAKAFNPDRNVTFKQFAWFRMRGEILDECRRSSFMSRTDVARGNTAAFISFDDVWDDTGEPKVTLSAHGYDIDNLIDLTEAIESLPKREGYVIRSLAEGYRGSEVATELGVSESRVSQIATAARQKLQERVAA